MDAATLPDSDEFLPPVAHTIWDMKYRFKERDGTPIDQTDSPMTDPATTSHPSLNAFDPHTGCIAAIWTIRCCPVCEPGLVADGAESEPCRDHGGDSRIFPTSSGQRSTRASHEPFHSDALARVTGAVPTQIDHLDHPNARDNGPLFRS